MSDVIFTTSSPSSAILPPTPRCSMSVRAATPSDLPFIDGLQKTNTRMVGFLHRQALEEKIADGAVLIAEDERAAPLGYIIAKDKYLRRDDVGVVYQLNVMPGSQRNLIGASLVKAAFERAAYGCRLFCCWCAQDLSANSFWEALGFVPLAFRTGCQRRQRIHIFWQRRIRENDQTTPYWFPSQTTSGAFREDRLVLPIPPGTHWRDVMPIVLPGMERVSGEEKKRLPGSTRKPKPQPRNPSLVTSGGLRFVAVGEKLASAKPKREPRAKMKNDPKYVAAARELRDRYLEHVNAEGSALPQGKYDVSRQLDERSTPLLLSSDHAKAIAA